MLVSRSGVTVWLKPLRVTLRSSSWASTADTTEQQNTINAYLAADPDIDGVLGVGQ